MKKGKEDADERRMIIQALVSADARNNWIIFVVVIVSGFIIYANVVLFTEMITGVSNNINTVVNNTSKNMTLLTTVLIEQERQAEKSLDRAVSNQTRAFVAASDNQTHAFIVAVGNFTDIISNYSVENDKNLKRLASYLDDFNRSAVFNNNLTS